MRDSHGEITCDADKARSRWEEHFAELFGGELCDGVPEAIGCALEEEKTIWPSAPIHVVSSLVITL